MKRTGKPNMLLMELVIVLLFFSLSAAVILELFVAAYGRSLRAETDTAVTLLAEDLADRFAESALPAEDFFSAEGFSSAEAGRDGAACLEKTGEVLGHAVRLSLVGRTEAGPAGALDGYDLMVYDGDREALSLPLVRYRPEGGKK